MSDEIDGIDQAQLDPKDTIVTSSKEQQQYVHGTKGLRPRRRRPKRHRSGGGGESSSTMDDQWYDAPYELVSSGCVSPIENELSISTSKEPLHSLPQLLYERELYGRLGNNRFPCRQSKTSWMRRMLFDTKDADCNDDDLRVPQRLYHKQALKFSYLRTSIMDAVLGIEPNGNYVVALSKNCDKEEDQDFLYLRFCGLPSCKNHTLSVAPLLMSIPMSINESSENSVDDNLMPLTPVQYPLRVWLSTDGLYGACLYRTHRSVCTNDKIANVVLFSLPGAISRVIENEYDTVFYQWNDVPVPMSWKLDWSPIDDANLWIRVNCYPIQKRFIDIEQHWVCDTINKGIPLYLFLIDVDDGFRLTWIRPSKWDDCELHTQDVTPLWENIEKDIIKLGNQHHYHDSTVRGTKHSRIVVPISNNDSGWQPMIGNPIKGDFQKWTNEQSASIALPFTIAFSCFFSVTSLLRDILNRRPSLISPKIWCSCSKLPNFTYHLVDVTDGRVAEILLVFARGYFGKGCVGLFVEVDLFTQDYREIEWICHPTHDTPPPHCAQLASDRRKNTVQSDLGDVELLDILYPDCITMDNKAIRRELPTKFMSARSANVTISYC